MNWQEFENSMKHHVQAHQTPVDVDALWDKVRHRKRRRVGLFFWIFAGFFVTGGVGVAYFYRNGSAKKILISALSNASPQVGESNSVGKPAPALDFSNAFLESGQNAGTKIASKQGATTEPSSGKPNLKDGACKTILHAAQPQQKTPFIPNPGLVPAIRAANLVQAANTSGMQQPVYHSIFPTPSTPRKLAPLDSVARSFLPARTPPPGILPIDKSAAQSKKQRVYLGVEVGFYHWEIARDLLVDDNRLSRKGERTVEAYSMGIHAQKSLTGPWSIQAGVQYLRHYARFDRDTIWQERRQKWVNNYYINGLQDSTYSGETLVEYRRKINNYNTVNALNIPLEIQYSFLFKKAAITPFMGMQVQVLQSAKGMVLNTDGKPDKTLYPNLYKRNVLLGLRAGLLCETHLTPRLKLALGPLFEWDITPRTGKTLEPAERFKRFGMTLRVSRLLQ
jgi:hypothetical protein